MRNAARWTLHLLSRLSQGKTAIFAMGLAVTLGVGVLFLAEPAWLRFQNLKLYDVLLRQEREIKKGDIPVIVDIDDASLAELGQWPWPRYRLALLLARLKEADALGVGLDILFAESDRTSPATILEQFKKDLQLDVGMTGLPEQLMDYDEVLANVLGKGPFAISYYFDFEKTLEENGEQTAADSGDCPIPPLIINATKGEKGSRPVQEYLLGARGVLCPLPVLAKSAQAAGFFNAEPDEDNILRRTPLLIRWKDKVYPSLALATVIRALRVNNIVIGTAPTGIEYLNLSSEMLGAVRIPLDAQGRLFINYRGPRGAFEWISAVDVVNGKVPPEKLAGRIVYIGTSAAGLKDLRASPLDKFMPGVEVHATITDMILNRDFLTLPDFAPGVEAMVMLAVGVLSAALLAWTRAVYLLVPFVLLGAGLWFGAAEAMSRWKYYLSPLYPLMVLGLNFTLLTFLKFWREERQKRFIHSAFSHYLSPQVVEQIVDSPEKLSLEGVERPVTILFSDVRGFTSISEKLSPTQVVDLLHQYLTPMTRIVTDNMGTLDKFIGDAVMAFWNAPLDVPDHPDKALRSALAMLDELNELNKGFKETYGFAINIGVGLHYGNARVGNFGSEDLFDYTIIGDAVNLGSRLEGLTKFYGLRLLVSDALVERASDAFAFMEVDRVRVKGKAEPVTIYTVLTEEEAGRRAEETAQAAKAMELYKAGEFVEAKPLYDALAAAHGGRLYELYAERCAALAASPPEGDWDGVYVHTTK